MSYIEQFQLVGFCVIKTISMAIYLISLSN